MHLNSGYQTVKTHLNGAIFHIQLFCIFQDCIIMMNEVLYQKAIKKLLIIQIQLLLIDYSY